MLIQEPPSSPQLTLHSPLSLSCSMQAHLTRKMQQLLFPTAQHNFSFPHWPSTPGLTAHPTLLTYYTSCPWLPFPSAPFSFSLLGTRGSLLTLNPPLCLPFIPQNWSAPTHFPMLLKNADLLFFKLVGIMSPQVHLLGRTSFILVSLRKNNIPFPQLRPVKDCPVWRHQDGTPASARRPAARGLRSPRSPARGSP